MNRGLGFVVGLAVNLFDANKCTEYQTIRRLSTRELMNRSVPRHAVVPVIGAADDDTSRRT